uniref:Uncharacterized protein n=1 Tax=Rhizophora mucronata TaxID=61149 RepID=A0A2P2JEI2_RHIMU
MEPQLSTGPRRDPMHISVWSLFQSSGHWLAVSCNYPLMCAIHLFHYN